MLTKLSRLQSAGTQVIANSGHDDMIVRYQPYEPSSLLAELRDEKSPA